MEVSGLADDKGDGKPWAWQSVKRSLEE